MKQVYFVGVISMAVLFLSSTAMAQNFWEGKKTRHQKQSTKPGMELVEKEKVSPIPRYPSSQKMGSLSNPTPLDFLSQEEDPVFGSQY